MKITEQFKLFISDEKLTKYLLLGYQIRGSDKSKLFSLFGYSYTNSDLLKKEIISMAERGEVESISENEYGIFYVVSGKIKTPSGKELFLKTIWHVLDTTQTARFVTAYPKKL